jgi:membrane fusion protein, multidrug efflux system
MKRGLVIAIGAIAIGVLGAGAWRAMKPPIGPAEPKASASAIAMPAASAAIELVASDLLVVSAVDLSRQVPVTGSLRAVQQTVVKARVAGELKSLDVREGQTVKQGQRIGQIDTLEHEWRVKEREAQLQASEAQVASAQRTQDNNRQLLEKNFISQAAFDASRFALDTASGNRDAARAQLTLARKTLNDAALTAPISGVVAERFAQPGEKLSPDNRILSIINLSSMEIEASVPATELGGVSIGQAVALKVEGIKELQKGSVVRIAPSTSAGTRSVPVFIRLQSPTVSNEQIRAGLFAQGQLDVERLGNVLAVPAGALRDQAGRNTIYLIKNNQIEEREVKLGLRGNLPDGRAVVQIVQGLNAGEQIVASNLGVLKSGAAVKVKP